MPAILTDAPVVSSADFDSSSSYLPGQPTLASVWQAVTGSNIGDELLDWPPDLLALTQVILERSEAYRFALSPPFDAQWPPASMPGWPDAVADAARGWSAWAESRRGAVPGLLAREWELLRAQAEVPLSDLTAGTGGCAKRC